MQIKKTELLITSLEVGLEEDRLLTFETAWAEYIVWRPESNGQCEIDVLGKKDGSVGTTYMTPMDEVFKTLIEIDAGMAEVK